MKPQKRAIGMVVDDNSSYTQMAIVERYERFTQYMYPILQSCPRKHGIARDKVLEAMFDQIDMIIAAGKSGQISRLNFADANLARLRVWLRFLAEPTQKIITPNQHRVALAHLDEAGAMLGSWIKRAKGGG